MFDREESRELIKQMTEDIYLLQRFNLMDYSLLTVIEFNPQYVRLNPDEFKHNKKGELEKPVRHTNKVMKIL